MGTIVRLAQTAAAGVLFIVLLAGCAQPARVENTKSSPKGPTLEGMFAYYDQPRLDPEPSVDSAGGVYLCRIVDISGSPTLSVTIDLISDEVRPGTTKRQRERSSWPAYVGYNRYRHPQELAIPGAVMAITEHGQQLRVAGPKAFIEWFRADPDRLDQNFYVRFSGGSVQNLWPWTY